MKLRSKYNTVLTALIALVAFAVQIRAEDKVGKVCVEAISQGGRWDANDTGAKEGSKFTVQIDLLSAIKVTTNSSGVFTNLALDTKHLVKINVDGKPLTSFRFSFHESKTDHMRLWYNPFYGTWSLSPVGAKDKCACPKPSHQSPSPK